MFLVAMLAVAAGATAAGAMVDDPGATLGVYRGAAAPAAVAQFERWNGGREVRYALEFLPSDDWSSIAHPGWSAEAWRDGDERVVYSVPLLPRSEGTLAEGAAGAYDEHFASLARTLIDHGEGNAILRLGWEFNADWFPWAASRDPESFVAYWRRAVDAIRSVPGANFAIDWTVHLGDSAVAPDRVYPGDAYVDVIGLDAYDQGWDPGWQDPELRWRAMRDGPYGLRWHRAFAAAHGKPLSFPEWGLTIRPDGHGGGDNPAYVRRMHDWIAANDVLYHAYFEYDAPDGRHRLMEGQFPRAAAEFRRLFGPVRP